MTSTLGDLDLYLIGEGRHEKLWEILGSHVQRDKSGELLGTSFAVWAPNAQSVSLICDANYWDKNESKMRSLGDRGIWEIFIPTLVRDFDTNTRLHQKDGRWVDHADPHAKETETPPNYRLHRQ
ncbi:MAG: hypothetical protein WDO06_02070 [Actinomycetota bacterium]